MTATIINLPHQPAAGTEGANQARQYSQPVPTLPAAFWRNSGHMFSPRNSGSA
jgi:hypothetical protein